MIRKLLIILLLLGVVFVLWRSGPGAGLLALDFALALILLFGLAEPQVAREAGGAAGESKKEVTGG